MTEFASFLVAAALLGAIARVAVREAEGPRAPRPSAVPPDPPVPALGPVVAIPLRTRMIRAGAIVAAALATLGAFAGRTLTRSEPSERVPSIANAAWVIPDRVLRGGQPRDIDLVTIRESFGVTAIVSLRNSSTLDAAVARDLGLLFISVPVEKRAAPTRADLERIVTFVSARLEEGGRVLVHDEFGVDPVSTVSAMLAMLHGRPTRQAVTAALAAVATDRAGAFSPQQLAAINDLATALGVRRYRPPGFRSAELDAERYRDARALRW